MPSFSMCAYEHRLSGEFLFRLRIGGEGGSWSGGEASYEDLISLSSGFFWVYGFKEFRQWERISLKKLSMNLDKLRLASTCFNVLGIRHGKNYPLGKDVSAVWRH